MAKFKCSNSDIVDLVVQLIKNAEDLGAKSFNPISDSELSNIKQSLKTYKKNCNLCAGKGNNDASCHKAAELELMRSMPFINKTIYPWANYDWSYGNFVDNNYSVMATGASTDGSFSAIKKNIGAIIKLSKGFLTEGNPEYRSKAGALNKYGDQPIQDCYSSQFKLQSCLAKHKIKYGTPQKPPTTDPFLKMGKLDGENSSSYYVRVGACPRPDIKSDKECSKKGYDWIKNPLDMVMSKIPGMSQNNTKKGSCFQPRYAYINNKPGYNMMGVKMKGIVPALMNDVMALSPDKIFATLQGRSIGDSYVVQPCPDVNEGFDGYKQKTIINYKSIFVLLIIMIIIFYFW